MKRMAYVELEEWKTSPDRKPLLIRGARQVGKTYLVRQLGEQFEHFVEINLEYHPKSKKIFEYDLDPHRITRELSVLTGKKIIPGKTLLFLDEIQEAPQAISSLRYFYEIAPEQHIIAAGSLLEFELEKIGLPVGRICSLYIYPLSLLEFMKARKEELLIEALIEHSPAMAINDAIHQKALRILGEFMAVGGMPEAVAAWINRGDLKNCSKINRTIIDTYRQDFNKYVEKFQVKYVELLFNTLPVFQGKKFKFTSIPGEYRKRELMPALELLIKADIAHKIIHSKGTGIPLWSEVNPENFKINFLDVGLSQSILGEDRSSWILEPDVQFANKGQVTEAFVGQEFLAYSLADKKGELFYWNREARSSNAEVDYLLQKKDHILPIEVKSGSPGHLKSLQFFLQTHNGSPRGIRFSNQNFAIDNHIHSYPLYAVFKLIPPDPAILSSFLS
jgi:predicted AAA+ superfamily ATPase